MNGDIRPPARPKPRKIKRLPQKVLAPVELAPETKAESELEPDVSHIKPLQIDPVIERSKKISLANIRGNLHPKHWYNLTRQEQWVLFGGLLALFIGILLASYFLVFKTDKVPLAPVQKKAPPAITTVAAPLTGLQIDPALAKRPVTAIMVENSLDARPQSGLQDAGVVYEAIAEAGITRFMGLFQDTRPGYIGPVRSLRPYYIDFATPWDASIAHVGGSPDALAQIRNGGKDLDQFFNSGAYWRQNTRDAPHNVYTSFDGLDALNLSKGYIASSPHGWPHKADKKLATPSAKTIDLAISSGDFNVHYDYDATSNSYLRSEGGKPHIVTASAGDNIGVQLKPKVVIALVLPLGRGELDASGAYYSDYTVSGSGNAYIFQDGGVTQAIWSKADRGSQFTFKDASGNEIKLNAGQVWLSALSADNQVQYTP
jgi:hypothetical protein